MTDHKDDITNKKQAAKDKSKEVISYYLKEPYVPFVICIILALILNEILTLAFFPWFVCVSVGFAFLFLGLLIFKWSLKHINLNGETWSPLKMESQVMIVFGPYHYSRNPIFLSAVMIYMSLFFFLNNFWGFVLLLPLIALLNRYVIKPRERFLKETYEDTYEDYHRKTSRWI